MHRAVNEQNCTKESLNLSFYGELFKIYTENVGTTQMGMCLWLKQVNISA